VSSVYSTAVNERVVPTDKSAPVSSVAGQKRLQTNNNKGEMLKLLFFTVLHEMFVYIKAETRLDTTR